MPIFAYETQGLNDSYPGFLPLEYSLFEGSKVDIIRNQNESGITTTLAEGIVYILMILKF